MRKRRQPCARQGRLRLTEDAVELGAADRARSLRHATTRLAHLDLAGEVPLLLALHTVGIAGICLGHSGPPSVSAPRRALWQLPVTWTWKPYGSQGIALQPHHGGTPHTCPSAAADTRTPAVAAVRAVASLPGMAELSDVRYRQLRVERRDRGVVLATLDNPDRRNSMSGEMTRSWAELMTTVSNDASVRCLVVTGAGSAFCSGGDMDWLAATPNASVDDLRERMLPFYRTWLAIRDLPVPSIAAVNGPAVGAGLCLALACDLRYASADASLSAPFTALGLHAGMAATWLLPQFGGLGLARELLLTGRVLTGTDAAAAGLVNRSFPAESLLTEALGIAGSIAAKAPIATRLTKAALAEGAPVSIEAALQWEALAQPVTMATADLREGLAAQRERRKPEFTGR